MKMLVTYKRTLYPFIQIYYNVLFGTIKYFV